MEKLCGKTGLSTESLKKIDKTLRRYSLQKSVNFRSGPSKWQRILFPPPPPLFPPAPHGGGGGGAYKKNPSRSRVTKSGSGRQSCLTPH